MKCYNFLKHLGSDSFSVESQNFKSVVRRISSYEAKTGTKTQPKTYFSDPLVVTQLGGGKKKCLEKLSILCFIENITLNRV